MTSSTTWINNFTNPFPGEGESKVILSDDGVVDSFTQGHPSNTATTSSISSSFVNEFDITFNVVAEDPVVLLFNVHVNAFHGTNRGMFGFRLIKNFNGGSTTTLRECRGNNICSLTGNRWVPLQISLTDVPEPGANRYRLNWFRLAPAVGMNFQNGKGFSHGLITVYHVPPEKVSTNTDFWTWSLS